MKRLFTLLLISFAALSCEMIDEKLDDLLDKRDWVVFAEGTELTANVPSKQTVLNYKFESTLDWEVKTDAEWLEIDPMSGKAGKGIKIQIKVLHNKDKDGRTGYADLTLSNDESYRITINQAGEGDENDFRGELFHSSRFLPTGSACIHYTAFLCPNLTPTRKFFLPHSNFVNIHKNKPQHLLNIVFFNLFKSPRCVV